MTLVRLEDVTDGLLWKFHTGTGCWGYPNTVDMTIYRKDDIAHDLCSLPYISPNTLEGHWASRARRVMGRYGLCYPVSKIVNLPLNRVQNQCENRHMNFMTPQELLNLFMNGKKIDISTLWHIDNKSAHTEYEPTFILRN